MRKVFILGAHRSGTSKLASYFQEVIGFSGYGEGHIWRLVPHITRGRREIQKTIPKDAYEINRIGFPKILGALVKSLDTLISEHHGRDFFDKTPGFMMIEAAPHIHRHIPEAKFIHVHRSGIDNVASNLRRWPNRGFKDACRMWNSSINAFLANRDKIADRLYLIEMEDMKTGSWKIHQDICAHIGIENRHTQAEIEAYFAEGSKTSTRPMSEGKGLTLEETDWTEQQKAHFMEECGENMRKLGYFPAEPE